MAKKKIKNLEELAKAIGVSRTTLSKYFNKPSSLKQNTYDKVSAALEDYEYQPNIYAMNQNRRFTNNIGIIIHYMADPLFGEITHSLERIVSEAGYNPITLSSRGEAEQEKNNLDTLLSIRPAGAIIAPIGNVSDANALRDFCKQIPTVLFDKNIPDIETTYVGSDNEQSIPLMVDYLCRSGEPPCFFEIAPLNPNANIRRESYCQAMQDLGHKPNIVRISGDGWIFEDIAYREGKKILNSGEFPSSTILCSNDRLAVGLMAAAFELGIKVGLGPDFDMRIAGHDNHPFSRYTCPPLTTIAQDYDAIARKSVSQLVEVIESGGIKMPDKQTLFEGTLLMRRSA